MQAYKIDRINLITYKCQKKKILKSVRCRYLAKSHIVNCNAQNQSFVYANFRGAIFKKVKFQNSIIIGCDFNGTKISDCVFMACKFKNCNFTGATISYTTIVNTSLAECKNVSLSKTTKIYKNYPNCVLSEKLTSALETLKSNKNLRTYKLLSLSDKKYNELNLFLLQQRFTDEILPLLLMKLNDHSMKNITTYKKLERQLKSIETDGII